MSAEDIKALGLIGLPGYGYPLPPGVSPRHGTSSLRQDFSRRDSKSSFREGVARILQRGREYE